MRTRNSGAGPVTRGVDMRLRSLSLALTTGIVTCVGVLGTGSAQANDSLAEAVNASSVGTAADTHHTASSTQSIPHSSKFGKKIYIVGKSPGCRIMAFVGANKVRASGFLKVTCEHKTKSTIAGALSLNNQKFKDVRMRAYGKTMSTKWVSLKNPKGTQKFCMMGWWMHPLYPDPQYRSEAKACVKY